MLCQVKQSSLDFALKTNAERPTVDLLAMILNFTLVTFNE